MALNIKDPETVRLAAEVAALAGETKTGAVRQALKERKERLLLAKGGRSRGERLREFLERELWPSLPPVSEVAPSPRRKGRKSSATARTACDSGHVGPRRDRAR
jgi:antitoxin VapB